MHEFVFVTNSAKACVVEVSDSADTKSDSIWKNFDSIHWQWRPPARGQKKDGERGVVANFKFSAVEKLSEN